MPTQQEIEAAANAIRSLKYTDALSIEMALAALEAAERVRNATFETADLVRGTALFQMNAEGVVRRIDPFEYERHNLPREHTEVDGNVRYPGQPGGEGRCARRSASAACSLTAP